MSHPPSPILEESTRSGGELRKCSSVAVNMVTFIPTALKYLLEARAIRAGLPSSRVCYGDFVAASVTVSVAASASSRAMASSGRTQLCSM